MTPRFHSVVSAGALLIAAWLAPVVCLTPLAQAQEGTGTPAAGSIQEELKALRQMIEQQSKQIDMLTAQITRLGSHLGAGSAPLPASNPGGGETAAPAVPPARVSPPQGITPTNVHIIVKGDSLDKIAKQHNTTVAELMRLNKIPDPKRLQIGDQIVLPTAPEKKEGQ